MVRALTLGLLLSLAACDKQKQQERLKEAGIDPNSPVGVIAAIPTSDNIENTRLLLTQPAVLAGKIVQPLQDSIPSDEIVQIPPQTIESCFEKSGKIINEVFAKCRRGSRERWHVYRDGRRVFIQELPVN
ncbi:hypothetical protein [Nevskia sp.]|uniref:hypothetical protein n=1 Tax=Nevskia sp. TaxID=1929292 RepID=UPI0025F5862B|nr:hypothetical protein [Nevskia sp.]